MDCPICKNIHSNVSQTCDLCGFVPLADQHLLSETERRMYENYVDNLRSMWRNNEKSTVENNPILPDTFQKRFDVLEKAVEKHTLTTTLAYLVKPIKFIQLNWYGKILEISSFHDFVKDLYAKQKTNLISLLNAMPSIKIDKRGASIQKLRIKPTHIFHKTTIVEFIKKSDTIFHDVIKDANLQVRTYTEREGEKIRKQILEETTKEWEKIKEKKTIL